MKILIIIALLFTPSLLNAQNIVISNENLKILYTDAIRNKIDIMLQGGPVFFEENEVTIKIDNPFGHIKFLSKDELIQASLNKKRTINAYRITHKVISKDTIDVSFGIVRITAQRKPHFNKGLKFVKANFEVDCGGTNGYKPDYRFALNPETDSWEIVLNQHLKEVNEKSH